MSLARPGTINVSLGRWSPDNGASRLETWASGFLASSSMICRKTTSGSEEITIIQKNAADIRTISVTGDTCRRINSSGWQALFQLTEFIEHPALLGGKKRN